MNRLKRISKRVFPQEFHKQHATTGLEKCGTVHEASQDMTPNRCLHVIVKLLVMD